jgi:hypothetical protein
MRTLAPCLALLIGLGCGADTPEDDVVDMRREVPALPEGGVEFVSPEYVIPAGTEKQMCWVTTYEGPDMAIVGQWGYQSPNGHHVVIFGTGATERDLPDGTSWDCTENDSLGMDSLEPILIGGEIEYDDDGVVNSFELPDGFGAPIEQGQRIVLQSHYVNVTQNDVLVQDHAQLALVPEDEITTWTAPLVNTDTSFAVPRDSDEYTLAFDCEFEETYSLLYVGGHLHEWGKAFSLDYTPAGGVPERVYDIPEWRPVLRDSPTYVDFEAGEFQVQPGDTFTTSCTWFNHEDHDLEFPQEMCVTFGMIYPSRVPVICSP